MAQKDWAQFLNEALKACAVLKLENFGPEQLRRMFPGKLKTIHIFSGYQLVVDARAFDRAISRLLESGVGTTVSKEELERPLIPILLRKCKNAAVFGKAEAEEFKVSIESRPIREYTVAREMFGVTFPAKSKPLNVGVCTIYDWKRHKRLIGGRDQVEKPWDWGNKAHVVMVECKVQARDEQRAKELSDATFYSLENILHFFAGIQRNRCDIGILDYDAEDSRTYYMFSEVGISGLHGKEFSHSKFHLGELIRSDLAPSTTKLLDILSSQKTQFDRKVLRAVDWIGQAVRDPNPASAFVKATIPLEILFSNTEKGIITPSITAQIAEGCAHFLGNSIESCQEIEKTMKDLYGTRSAIVHAGRDNVSREDVRMLIETAKSALLAVLAVGSIDSADALSNYVRQKKYAGCMLQV